MERNPKDKVIVITGGAQGIGFSVAENFFEKMAKVIVIIDIDEKTGLQAAQYFNSKYGENKCDFIKCDVTKDLEETWEYIIKKYTYVDVLVNSAGMDNERDASRTVGVNLTSVIKLSLQCWEHMRKDRNGKGGTIINLSSILGFRTEPFLPIYSATKFGVLGFSKSLGHCYNYNRTGVRALAMCPGYTDTNLLKDFILPDDAQMMKDIQKFKKANIKLQNVEVVGKATVEVFETAESGTAWLIENSEPVTEIL